MTDASGTIVWADHKPFGEATITVSTITNSLRFNPGDIDGVKPPAYGGDWYKVPDGTDVTINKDGTPDKTGGIGKYFAYFPPTRPLISLQFGR